MLPPDRDRIRRDFHACVNMSATELAAWLGTDESWRVGWKGDGGSGESVGHAAGRNIVALLRKPVEALDDADYAHMRKAVGVCRRHLAQPPDNKVTSRWRYALMNWGHDPLKD
ncbi:DUF3140 domain-containing protein [Sphingomonas flavalba]|uniref:DUF3140 domain-containing protein n=1 Tax=Sphingomonas flavalba TaxID=2559804 RepID=UPI0039E0D1E5